MTTSIKAGSPFLTTSTAARKAGPRSFGIGDGPAAENAHALRDSGVVDWRVIDRQTGMDIGDAPLVLVGHALYVHELLMVAAVVVHHAQQRNPVMRGGPQDTGRVHQVAVILDGDAQTAVFPVRQRGSGRRGRTVADAAPPDPPMY